MYTKPFEKISKNDSSIAGGKGASLGEMAQSGVPVPSGFVILAESFDQFLKETDLDVEIDSILHTVNHQEMHTVEHASEKIQQLILGAKMPEDIAQEISNEFQKLGIEFVAVRSSATAEDSSSAAWAGQLDSFLNTDEETLLSNVQRCWASLFTPRAIFYRFEQGLHSQKISVAVVVQKMVESEISGIAFSVHPVTEDRNQLIIEAGFGLGEAIVSGQITPDSYVVEKEPRRIIDINISEQSKALYRAYSASSGQANEWKDLGEKGKEQALTEMQILELSELVLKIEKHYGFPCDVEWAYEGGRFFITQSRPITTLTLSFDESHHINEKIEFVKAYSRDTSLFVQGLWAKGLNEQALAKFGWKNPHIPFVAHFVNDGVVEIWEHKKAIEWFLNRLLEENKKGLEFLNTLYGEFKELSKKLKELHKKEYLISVEDRTSYIDLVYQLAFVETIFFYTGIDERSPEEGKEISVRVRNEGDFFAENDLFARKNIAHFANVSEELAGAVLPEEFNSIPNEELLRKRTQAFLIIDGKEACLGSIKEYVALHPNYYFEQMEIEAGLNEVSGQIAYKGNVCGIARIVKKQSDMNRIAEGDILVSPMTTPNFLPAMQKAAAFVTDEGGVTCHASIVAREMKKPCIIGTKIATQVLHDGDLVEVDADNGAVRIIEKAK
ncbi:MAG: PEP-utilizing enzyme [Candidatus Parcubacteria bacterium]|nr:PEP-utilizing enzyme [Candidatus Parcubacteria bacterium]